MSAPHPYQVLCKASPSGEDSILIAACGPALISARLSRQEGSNQVISRWPHSSASNGAEENGKEPQSKKRKLDHEKSTLQPTITHVIVAPDQQHIVAVTGVDKCIRVFTIVEGVLVSLSERCMPKRPSAIQITDDSKTIICGDKFGDVYALPLHPSEDGEAQVTHSNGAEQKRVYEPTATETTVHTKRNLKALQEQMRAKGKLIKLTKEPSAFEHKLLLGHVSMLTDMQLTTLEVNGKRRRYIVTCDRDEHIRVSRGIPQAHVTESYCLGHTEFVHRVRQIPDTNILVSAGGDDWLGVWDWTTGQLLGRKDLRPIQNDQGSNKKQIAVSNIWTVVTSNSSSVVIVACEGISKLALITSSNLTVPDGSFSIVDTSDQGQIMDLIDLGAGKVLLSSQRKRLQTFALEGLDTGLTMKHDTSSSSLFEALNNIKIPPTDQESLDGLLNGVERLRKRDNEGEQDD